MPVPTVGADALFKILYGCADNDVVSSSGWKKSGLLLGETFKVPVAVLP